jgi:predicted esterase
VVLASLVLAVAGAAIAAKSGPHLTVKGSAHASGGKLQGGFTVENTGKAKAPALGAAVKLVSAGKKPTRLTVQRASIPALAPGDKQRVQVKAAIPGKADSGTWSILACADSCVKIGKLGSAAGGDGTEKKKATAPNAPVPVPAVPTPQPPAPISTVPTTPIAHPVDEPFFHAGGGVEYWGFVPSSYDASNQTPTTLFIWMHGCGGEAEGDAWTYNPAANGKPQDWLMLSLGGRDGSCWTPSVDEAKVLAALADFETHFNINRHRVLLGGYSSGGDLAYRTGFRNSSTFSGLLIENSAPFRDTESTQAESLAAATTKLHIVHLAHTGDAEYPIAMVREETEAVKAAGFPIELIERPGTHFDSHTDSDLIEVLLPFIDAGWTSP